MFGQTNELKPLNVFVNGESITFWLDKLIRPLLVSEDDELKHVALFTWINEPDYFVSPQLSY